MGKIKVLDQLMRLRSLENSNITWGGKPLDPGIWLSDAKYAAEIEEFAREFSVLFPPDDSGVDCGECVAKVLDAFAKARLERLRRLKNYDRFEIFYTAIWKRLGEPVRTMVRPLLRRDRPLMDMAQALSESGVAIDMEEIRGMVTFLTDFDETA